MTRDFGLPICGALVAAACCSVLLLQCGPPKESQALAILSAGISIASIGLGFLATVGAVIMSSKENRALRALRELPQYTRLVALLLHGMAACFALAVLSSVLLVVPLAASPLVTTLGAIWAAALAYAGVATALIAHFLAILLRH